MEKFLKSRLAKYLLYVIMFQLMSLSIGFETTMLLIGAFIVGDIEFNNENKNNI